PAWRSCKKRSRAVDRIEDPGQPGTPRGFPELLPEYPVFRPLRGKDRAHRPLRLAIGLGHGIIGTRPRLVVADKRRIPEEWQAAGRRGIGKRLPYTPELVGILPRHPSSPTDFTPAGRPMDEGRGQPPGGWLPSGDVTQHAGEIEEPPPLRFGNRVIGPNELEGLLVGQQIAALLFRLGLRTRCGRILLLDSLEEEADRDAERLGDVPEPRGADPVHAGLVFLDLLELDADDIAELLLGHSDHPPPVPDPLANMHVNRVFHRAALLHVLRPVSKQVPCQL